MTENLLHDAVRLVRSIGAKDVKRREKEGNDSHISLGTILSPPPDISLKLDDAPFTFQSGEVLINEQLVEHKLEQITIEDKLPGEHSVAEGSMTVKLPLLKSGDRVLVAQVGRHKAVVIAKVVAP